EPAPPPMLVAEPRADKKAVFEAAAREGIESAAGAATTPTKKAVPKKADDAAPTEAADAPAEAAADTADAPAAEAPEAAEVPADEAPAATATPVVEDAPAAEAPEAPEAAEADR